MPGDCAASQHLLRSRLWKRLPTVIGVHLQTEMPFGITTLSRMHLFRSSSRFSEMSQTT